MNFLKAHVPQTLLTILAVIVSFQLLSSIDRLETDPLTIEAVEGVEKYTLTDGDEFTFKRKVCVTADLIVTVHREFHNVLSAEKYMLPSISYVGYAKDGCFKIEFASSIPHRIPAGVYEYRPILVYEVNDSLTISKPAPPVRLIIRPYGVDYESKN